MLFAPAPFPERTSCRIALILVKIGNNTNGQKLDTLGARARTAAVSKPSRRWEAASLRLVEDDTAAVRCWRQMHRQKLVLSLRRLATMAILCYLRSLLFEHFNRTNKAPQKLA